MPFKSDEEAGIPTPPMVGIATKRSKGRPKKTEGELRCLSVRLTPTSQQPIDFKARLTAGDFKKLVAAREGGIDGVKLHYHLYCETLLSDTTTRGIWGKLTGGIGNAAYSQTIAHNGTEGYAVKDEEIVYSEGYTPKEISELIEKSREYRRQTTTASKQKQRAQDKLLVKAMESVAEVLKVQDLSPTSTMELLLNYYDDLGARFPMRGTLETAVMKLLYKTRKNLVVDWYAKNLVPSQGGWGT